MTHALWCFRTLMVVVLCATAACAGGYIEAGDYRIVTATDGFFGLRCQPRTELYFVDRTAPATNPVYLGTCSTPRFVTEQLDIPGDPSCFAVSEDGASLVYMHLPNWCGAGDKALRKPGGVYLHSAARGDTLLYSERQVGQIWSRAPLEDHAIRVGWHSADTSRSGAVCSQKLILGADGSERPDGEPFTIHGCRSSGS